MVPTWVSHIQSLLSGTPPRLLESAAIEIPVRPVAGSRLHLALPKDAPELSEFWERWFSPSQASRCYMPVVVIMKALEEKRWTAYIIRRNDTHAIIGTIVCRNVKGLRVKQARWPSAGVVDFFCVHPAWRKRGVGRQLLATLQEKAQAAANSKGPAPHLILWEGLHLTVPPLSVGILWMKRCSGGVEKAERCDYTSWAILASKSSVATDFQESPETTVWKTRSGVLAIWNTFHRSIPEGAPIHTVIAYSSKEAVEEYTRSQMAAGCILLSDTRFTGWTLDSPFQWIAYNLLPGFTDTSFPCIAF